jgi:putative Mn2+ efflux pump MntP
MGLFDLLVLSISASIDTFAVSLCKGMTEPKPKLTALACCLWFSCFQVAMLLLGFFVCNLFSDYVKAFDHWLAFFLFLFLGAVMLKESFSKKEQSTKNGLGFKSMLVLSLATSIDSCVVGISTSLLNTNIALLCIFIIIFTCFFACMGVFVGFKFGNKYKKLASLIGGVMLILIGVKILMQDLFF